MELSVSVEQGVWRLTQDSATMELVLYKFGEEVERIESDRLYSWEEMYDLMLRLSYERRGEK